MKTSNKKNRKLKNLWVAPPSFPELDAAFPLSPVLTPTFPFPEIPFDFLLVVVDLSFPSYAFASISVFGGAVVGVCKNKIQ